MAYTHIPVIVISALIVVLNIAPLWWHWTNRNSSAACMAVWIILLNLQAVVGQTVWFSDEHNKAPIVCDISVKLQLGGQVGLLASTMCIAKFLATIVSPRATAITRRDRRNRAIFDYSLSFGVPALIMATHILYQPDRFLIQTGGGCFPTVSLTWPTLILFQIWPSMFAIVGVLYSAYVVYRLIRHRRDFSRVIVGTHSALSTKRFLRLAGLCISYLLVGLPITLWTTYTNLIQGGSYFDYSWKYLHSGWKYTPTIAQQATFSLGSWVNVIAGILFLAAFGFGEEALSVYGRLARLFGWRPKARHSPTTSHQSEVTQVSFKPTTANYTVARDDGAIASDDSTSLPFHVVRGTDQSKIEVQRDVKVVIEDDGKLV